MPPKRRMTPARSGKTPAPAPPTPRQRKDTSGNTKRRNGTKRSRSPATTDNNSAPHQRRKTQARISTERNRLQRLGPAAIAGARIKYANCTKKTLVETLDAFNISTGNKIDAGLARAILFTKLGLGIPSKHTWTLPGIRYLLKNALGKDIEQLDMSSLATATAELQGALLEDGASDEEDRHSPEPQAIQQWTDLTHETTQSNEDRRATLLAELASLPDERPSNMDPIFHEVQPQTPSQSLKEWGSINPAHRRQAGSLFLNNYHWHPTAVPEGWEAILNFPTTAEYLPSNYHRPSLAGLHFYTATAVYLSEQPDVASLDTSGLRQLAITPRMPDASHEWICRIYSTAIQRLVGGTTREQLNISTTVRSNLAGAAMEPPDPIFLATFIAQIVAAGGPTNASGTRGRQPHQTGVQHKYPEPSRPPTLMLPAETRESIINQASLIAGRGITRTTIENAARALEGHAGATPRDKQIAGCRGLNRGKIKESTSSELISDAVHTATQTLNGHLAISVESIMSADITKGNAMYLNLQSEVMQRCLHALATRKFTSKDFRLAAFVPRIPGAPTLRELDAAFGEANRCVLDGTVSKVKTEDHDRRFYPSLRSAVTIMMTADLPSFDFGFNERLSLMIRDLSTWEENGMPLSQATRLLAKVLLNAQLRRGLDIGSNPPASDGTLLSYRDTAELQEARRKASIVTRETMDDEQTRWLYQFQRAMANGEITLPVAASPRPNGSKDIKERGRTATRQHTTPQRPPPPPATPRDDQRTNDRRQPSVGSQRNDRRSRSQETQKEQKGHNDSKEGRPDFSMAQWKARYGKHTTPDGKQIQLCYFHANASRGCRHSADKCAHSHTYPEEYKGRNFTALSPETQAEVTAACCHQY